MKANSYTLLNNSTDPAILSSTRGHPRGSLSEVSISEDGTNQTAPIKVPVLDATLPEYKEYLPEGSEPTVSATATPTPTEAAKATSSHAKRLRRRRAPTGVNRGSPPFV